MLWDSHLHINTCPKKVLSPIHTLKQQAVLATKSSLAVLNVYVLVYDLCGDCWMYRILDSTMLCVVVAREPITIRGIVPEYTPLHSTVYGYCADMLVRNLFLFLHMGANVDRRRA